VRSTGFGVGAGVTRGIKAMKSGQLVLDDRLSPMRGPGVGRNGTWGRLRAAFSRKPWAVAGPLEPK
jgi:hypothetical protein